LPRARTAQLAQPTNPTGEPPHIAETQSQASFPAKTQSPLASSPAQLKLQNQKEQKKTAEARGK
jgi:hypothetical protein